VAAVLVLSKGFQHSGLVDWIAGQTVKAGGNLMVQPLALTGNAAVLSAFMNNVGEPEADQHRAGNGGRTEGNPQSEGKRFHGVTRGS
jgi:hypothetical protein